MSSTAPNRTQEAGPAAADHPVACVAAEVPPRRVASIYPAP